ncbi:MAG TPA: TolC family protein [Bacteroidota bacterium]|nr:TolC family protein [Bacteroidota bacterium]
MVHNAKSGRTQRFLQLAVSVLQRTFLLGALCSGVPPRTAAQEADTSVTLPAYTLPDCIAYAMDHQPEVHQASIGISVAKTENAISLSGWLPQVGLTGSLLHYNRLPTTLEPNPAAPGGPPVATHVGVVNTATPQLSASETLFDPSLLYAARSAPLHTEQAEQALDSVRIGIVAAVSKTFYNLFLTLQQVDVLKEDTSRLGQDVADAFHQYVGGIADETDYQQAVITLNNTKAQLKQEEENEAPAEALLKQAMGYPAGKTLNVVCDTARMMHEIAYDTTRPLDYERRIEYRQLQTARELQRRQTEFYELSFLPSIAISYNYVYEFESNTAPALFRNAYPYSLIGLSVTLPIFTGFSRIESIHRSVLQEEAQDWAEAALRSQIYAEYSSAMAAYKGSLYNLRLLEENKARAASVYRVVSLQYKQGVVSYLNIIVAETNLITAEIGYTDALFQVLASKIDLEKAMGDIPTNQ